MRAILSRLPIVVLLAGVSGALMLAPALLAYNYGDWRGARAFLYSGLLVLVVVTLIAIVTKDRPVLHLVRNQLLSVVAAFLLLPILLALPLHESLARGTYVDAWFEMVSMITTTGATLHAPGDLTEAETLWRALVAWGGGFLIWVLAVAIFAPLHLGGYEIAMTRASATGGPVQIGMARPVSERLVQGAVTLAPIYGGLTFALWVALAVAQGDGAGGGPFDAAILAMGTLATAGLSTDATPTRGMEVVLVLFFVFAFSRATFTKGVLPETRDLRQDPELNAALLVVLAISGLLFARHYLGAVAATPGEAVSEGLRAAWGSLFTVTSFLATHGMVSADWDVAQVWSGLPAPGLTLAALAAIGGGVATTAGGVKLLRIYALVKHGQREVGRLVYPSSIGGSGRIARYVRREGAFIAWVVFMLFVMSVALVMAGLAALGVGFEASLVATIAMLTNTGPLVAHATAVPLDLAALPDGAKALLAVAMVVGRVEALALVALFNPEFWRR
ncbi:MAG: potassium transporter TrkG [Shimia sp.]